MKSGLLLSILFLSIQSLADPLITCQLKDASNCTDCTTRVSASCGDHEFVGSLDLGLKPQKIQWLVSNSANGSDRILFTENFGLNLKGLQSQADFPALLKKQKITLGKTEKISVIGIQVSPGTALFKSQQGTELVAKMTLNPKRNIASESPPYQIGGIRRALKNQAKGSK